MRFPLAVRLLLLGLAISFIGGCASNNSMEKMEGTWTSLAAKIKGMEITSGRASLQFTKGGKVTFSANGRAWSGTYSLGMGDGVTLSFDRELGGRKSHYETITVKDNLLTMKDSDGTKMTFVKEEK